MSEKVKEGLHGIEECGKRVQVGERVGKPIYVRGEGVGGTGEVVRGKGCIVGDTDLALAVGVRVILNVDSTLYTRRMTSTQQTRGCSSPHVRGLAHCNCSIGVCKSDTSTHAHALLLMITKAVTPYKTAHTLTHPQTGC